MDRWMDRWMDRQMDDLGYLLETWSHTASHAEREGAASSSSLLSLNQSPATAGLYV